MLVSVGESENLSTERKIFQSSVENQQTQLKVGKKVFLITAVIIYHWRFTNAYFELHTNRFSFLDPCVPGVA